MRWTDCLLVISFTIIGVLCSFSDIKKNTIPNHLIAIGLIISLFLQVLSAFLEIKTNRVSWLIYVLISLLIALAIYKGGFWAAGDVKLYTVMVFSCPAWLFEETLNSSVVPYIYIFIPAAIYFIVDTIKHKYEKEERYEYVRISKSDLIDYLKVMICVSAWHSVLFFIFPGFCIHNSLFITTVQFILVEIFRTRHVFNNSLFLFIHFIIWCLTCFFGHFSFSIEMISIWIMIALVIFLKNEASAYNYQRVRTTEVKKGMILSCMTVLDFQKSNIKCLPHNISEDLSAKLTEEEAAAVKRWASSVHGKPTIIVVRKIPFAIFIYLGYYLFILMKMKGI